jgi:hypothetical protein
MGVKAHLNGANPDNLVLGAGAIYFNYGEVSEAAIGATRGGSTFTVEREIVPIEQDGAYGAIKGLKKKIRIQPILLVNAMELNTTTYAKFFAGMTVSTSNVDYDLVTENVAIADGDYLTNVAFVGETEAGDDVVIIVKNALGDGSIEFAIEDKNEIVPEVQFTGHYLSSALTTVPYEVRFPKNTADTTPPTVTSVPADGASGFAVSGNIVWTFSEAIKSSTINLGNFLVTKNDGTAIAGALTYNAGQTEVTFNPDSNFTASTTYIATVSKNVTDVNGNALASNNVINFATA